MVSLPFPLRRRTKKARGWGGGVHALGGEVALAPALISSAWLSVAAARVLGSFVGDDAGALAERPAGGVFE